MYGIDHREFELIVGGIERCLELYANAARWPDLAVVVKWGVCDGVVRRETGQAAKPPRPTPDCTSNP